MSKIGCVLAVLLCAAASSAWAAGGDDFLVWNYYAGGEGDTTVDLFGRLHVPPNYDPQQAYPLVIFLHGLGEGGTDNAKQINSNIDNLLAHCKQRRALLYAPQSPTGWWGDGYVNYAMAKVVETQAAYHIDPARIYVTGLSAGGGGVFNIYELHHASLAAAVPICAACGGARARASVLVGKPMWAFHAADDGTVNVSQTRGALNSIRSAASLPTLTFPLDANPANPYYNTGEPYYTDGSTFFDEDNLRYTEYDTGGHWIWGRVYNESWMYDWLWAISLGDVNTAPSVDAGADVETFAPATVTLEGWAFDDGRPAPAAMTTAWTQVAGGGVATFADPAAAATTVNFSQPGTYVLRLTTDDGEFQTFDEITVAYKVPPTLAYVRSDLGDDLCGWTFRIDPGDADPSSYMIEVGFRGVDGASIQQALYNGVATIHTEALAAMVDGTGTPPYCKDRDTWVFSTFADHPMPGTNPLTGAPLTGFYEAVNAYVLSCFSGALPGGDVNLLYVVADGNVEWTGTVNRDGDVYALQGATETPSEPLPGDFNGDGSVSGADYVLWADTFGNQAGPGVDMRADANGDDVISGTDYVVWADNFGRSRDD